MSLIQHAKNKMWDQVSIALNNCDDDDVNMTLDGDTALKYAAKAKNHCIIKALLDNYADPNIPDCYGCVPLLYAIMKSSTECVIALINGGTNLHSNGYLGATPLHWVVAFCPSDNIINMLLTKGVDPSALCSDGWTALDVARHLKRENIVVLLEEITDSPYKQYRFIKKIGIFLNCYLCIAIRRYHEIMDYTIGGPSPPPLIIAGEIVS